MNPIEFEGQTTILAKNQPPYLPLPVHLRMNEQRVMTSCWELSLRERIKIFFRGKLWLRQQTFGRPLQPLSPTVDKPEEIK